MGLTVLVFRHAIAADRTEFMKRGKRDADRPLTTEGVTKMRRNAQGVRKLVPNLPLVLCSPWLRATQTALLIQEAYPKAAVEVTESLVPSRSSSDLLRVISKFKQKKVVAIVGHEPFLSRFILEAISGPNHAFAKTSERRIKIRKGSLCILEFSGTIGLGKAKIQCLIPPQIIRRLRD